MVVWRGLQVCPQDEFWRSLELYARGENAGAYVPTTAAVPFPQIVSAHFFSVHAEVNIEADGITSIGQFQPTEAARDIGDFGGDLALQLNWKDCGQNPRCPHAVPCPHPV